MVVDSLAATVHDTSHCLLAPLRIIGIGVGRFKAKLSQNGGRTW